MEMLSKQKLSLKISMTMRRPTTDVFGIMRVIDMDDAIGIYTNNVTVYEKAYLYFIWRNQLVSFCGSVKVTSGQTHGHFFYAHNMNRSLYSISPKPEMVRNNGVWLLTQDDELAKYILRKEYLERVNKLHIQERLLKQKLDMLDTLKFKILNRDI